MTRFAFDATRGLKDDDYTNKEYTPESLVKKLVTLVPFERDDFVVDAGSGSNKVFFDNIPTTRKDEVEIDEGRDFLKYETEVDWVIGNFPSNLFLDFVFHSAKISKKGFAFLINNSRLNQLTPRRLEKLANMGFHLSAIHIFSIKKWFGRYYFILFTTTKNPNITYDCSNYGGEGDEAH